MKLHLHIQLPEGISQDEANALSAKLLRDAASRLDRGHEFGGFHYGVEESYEGGFMVGDFKWQKVGLNLPERSEREASVRAMFATDDRFTPEQVEEGVRIIMGYR